jgi:predicted negative regulator of RcsB-dependent stress response
MLEQAMRSEPSDPTINEHLGDAYWHAGRKIEARYAWRAALLTAEEDAIARLSEKADFGLTAKNAAR